MSELGGYAPPPEYVDREARAAGPIAAGFYRVVTNDGHIGHQDFASLPEARRYADDVASETDYDVAPPSAHIVDSGFVCVDIGISYAIRVPGKSAWESYEIFSSKRNRG